VKRAAAELADIQHSLHREASERRDAQIIRNITTIAQLEAVFAEDQKYPGWVELGWSRPTGAALDEVVAKLKGLKLTIRNTPLHAPAPSGTCLFTGDLAVETIFIARSY
jgi:prolyl-tRNA synthetase